MGGAGYVTSDVAGNIYLTGSFSIPADTIGSIILPRVGSSDMFLVKYDTLGNVIWATSAGGNHYVFSGGITCDSLGNVYVVGVYNGTTMSFDTTTITNTSGEFAMFLVKYDPCGNVVSATSVSDMTSWGSNGVALVSGSKDIIYATGDYGSPGVAFGSTTLTDGSAGIFDMFLAKWKLATTDTLCGLLGVSVISYNENKSLLSDKNNERVAEATPFSYLGVTTQQER